VKEYKDLQRTKENPEKRENRSDFRGHRSAYQTKERTNKKEEKLRETLKLKILYMEKRDKTPTLTTHRLFVPLL
jgi:hypothetical protein